MMVLFTHPTLLVLVLVGIIVAIAVGVDWLVGLVEREPDERPPAPRRDFVDTYHPRDPRR